MKDKMLQLFLKRGKGSKRKFFKKMLMLRKKAAYMHTDGATRQQVIQIEYKQYFYILENNGRLVGDWHNVYQHCLTVACAGQALSELLRLSKAQRDMLVAAAILHDWHKRIDVETNNHDTSASSNGLLELGVSAAIVSIAHSVGHTSLKWIEGAAMLHKAMHFIDDICVGSDIVEINERVDKTEATGRYAKLVEDYRPMLGGRNLFDVQKEIGKTIQNELESACHVKQSTLVDVIRSKINT